MNGFAYLSVPSSSSVFSPVDGDRSEAAASLQQRLRLALLDEIAIGLIVCDQHGQMKFANPAADQELACERVLLRLGQSLRCAGPASSALEIALRKAATKGVRQLLTLTHGGDSLMVAAVPLAMDNCPEPLVMLVLGRRGACSVLGLEMLSGIYGLTYAERRVLCGLVDDVSPRDIAASGGVSLSTVRTQIASIRTKFGVRNIEGVLIRVAEVPVVPSALRRQALPQWGAPALRSTPVQAMAA